MNKSDPSRNQFMLKGPLAKRGYDWWWHNFIGEDATTGRKRSFFIEYYICNPALGEKYPILGQAAENKITRKRPSYAMIKVGTWGEGKKQIHNFFPISEFTYSPERLDLTMGCCRLTENKMQGKCSLSPEEARKHPEYMSDTGNMEWDLKIDKQIAFNVGYGASPFFRRLNAFEMFWHAEGIKTEFSGEVILDGRRYIVEAEKSWGYSDKNWGGDFTSPWLWISSCNLFSQHLKAPLNHSAVEFGGGRPRVFGIPLERKLLGCLVYEGEVFEYNFARFWKPSHIDFEFTEGEEENQWVLMAENHRSRLEMTLTCPVKDMLLIHYESPDGEKRHNRLWNGGTGIGIIRLFRKQRGRILLVDTLEMRNTGCEYGEYNQNPND